MSRRYGHEFVSAQTEKVFTSKIFKTKNGRSFEIKAARGTNSVALDWDDEFCDIIDRDQIEGLVTALVASGLTCDGVGIEEIPTSIKHRDQKFLKRLLYSYKQRAVRLMGIAIQVEIELNNRSNGIRGNTNR